MKISLKADARTGTQKSEIRQLRSSGQIPAVVYGEKIGAASITVAEKELTDVLRTNPNAVIELNLAVGGKHPVMIQEVQRHPLKRTLLHVDFHQINMDEQIRALVAVEIAGESPGVKEGGVLQLQLHEVEIRCYPSDIPSTVAVDISQLGIGENITVADLKLPESVEILSNLEDVVVTILTPQKGEEEADEAEAAASPETE